MHLRLEEMGWRDFLYSWGQVKSSWCHFESATEEILVTLLGLPFRNILLKFAT